MVVSGKRHFNKEGKVMKLMPSIASADPLAVGEVLKNLEAWPYLHIDIED